jgi:hypothetical protein
MEIISFIIQRFYYSLGSGCIINLFVLLNFFVLVKTEIVPEKFLDMVSKPEMLSHFVFIVLMILIGIIIEGIEEAGFQYYKELYDAKKLYKQTKQGRKKLTLKGKLLWFFFRKSTVVEACLYYWKKENNDGKIPPNSIYAFMCDPDSSGPVTALWTCAKRIVQKEKSGNVNRFKDLSFMIQLVRISFLFITVFNIAAALVTAVLWGITLNDNLITLGVFYLLSLVVSILVCAITTPIAMFFGKRFVRDVGSSYNALMIDGKIKRMKNPENLSPDLCDYPVKMFGVHTSSIL